MIDTHFFVELQLALSPGDKKNWESLLISNTRLLWQVDEGRVEVKGGGGSQCWCCAENSGGTSETRPTPSHSPIHPPARPLRPTLLFVPLPKVQCVLKTGNSDCFAECHASLKSKFSLKTWYQTWGVSPFSADTAGPYMETLTPNPDLWKCPHYVGRLAPRFRLEVRNETPWIQLPPEAAQTLSSGGVWKKACREKKRHLKLGVHSWNITYGLFCCCSFELKTFTTKKKVFGLFFQQDVPDVTHQQCTKTHTRIAPHLEPILFLLCYSLCPPSLIRPGPPIDPAPPPVVASPPPQMSYGWSLWYRGHSSNKGSEVSIHWR